MKITILTDNPKSWYIKHAKDLIKNLSNSHDVNHIFNKNEICKGDIMFILSCEKILTKSDLSFHKNNIVIHPSKLPLGKGWSPLLGKIIENKNIIPFTLFEANVHLDDGDIYFVEDLILQGHELNDEIKNLQGQLVNRMVIKFIDMVGKILPRKQIGEETFYERRRLSDSEIDINKSIKDQFNLLRIVDNSRYPAFFIHKNKKYVLKNF